jgi:hypothetical protein
MSTQYEITLIVREFHVCRQYAGAMRKQNVPFNSTSRVHFTGDVICAIVSIWYLLDGSEPKTFIPLSQHWTAYVFSALSLATDIFSMFVIVINMCWY